MTTWEGHRKTIKHRHSVGDFHGLTFSCYQRKQLFTNDSWRERLSRSIQAACEELSIELVAFVYMPEHIHLLVFPLEPQPDIGSFLSQVKRPVSDSVREQLAQMDSPLLKRLTVRERPGKESFRFWQEGPGFDRNLSDPKDIQCWIDYIHNNPVRRGLCYRAVDWKWSSARYYLLEPPCQQFPHLPWIHGIRYEALQSDT